MITENLEFYPNDFASEVKITSEEELARLEHRINQSLFKQLASQRRALNAQIAAEKSKIITGDRLPSPSVAADISRLDSLNQNVTLDQYHDIVASMISLVRQMQEWQVANLEPPLCNDVTSSCSD
jgi:hypothetical protein